MDPPMHCPSSAIRVLQDHHSRFLSLLRLTISSKTLPDLRWSKRGSTGSMVQRGLLQTAVNRSSCRSTLKSAFLVSSTSSSSCSLRFRFSSSCSLRRSFIVFRCFFSDGSSSTSASAFLLLFLPDLPTKPPSKVISMSSLVFLYFLLAVLRQSLRSASLSSLGQLAWLALAWVLIFLSASSLLASCSLMYMLQSILSSSFSVSLLQFFFLREAARESSGSSQLSATLLCPRALVMKFLTSPPMGSSLHCSLRRAGSNWRSSGMNLRSKGRLEFSNWLPSHSLQISSAVRLESHSITAQKYLRRCFSYSRSFLSSKALTSSSRSSSSCFSDFLHSFPLLSCLSCCSWWSFQMPRGPYFSSSSSFSLPMLDMQTLTLLTQPALVLKEEKRSMRSLEEMFIQSQLHSASRLVAATSTPLITCSDSSSHTLSIYSWSSCSPKSLSSEDSSSQFSIHSWRPPSPSPSSSTSSASSCGCSACSGSSSMQQQSLSSLLASCGRTLRPQRSMAEVALKEGSLIILLKRLSILTLVRVLLGVMNLGSQAALANLSSTF